MDFIALLHNLYLDLTVDDAKGSYFKLKTLDDNLVVERFFSSLKKEEIYRYIYNSFEHIKHSIDEYIMILNTLRPHGSLGLVTNNEFDKMG